MGNRQNRGLKHVDKIHEEEQFQFDSCDDPSFEPGEVTQRMETNVLTPDIVEEDEDIGLEEKPEGNGSIAFTGESQKNLNIQSCQDSHDKLVKWLIEMAGEENIQFNDPEIIQHVQTSILGEKLLRENDRFPYQRSQSSDSHVSLEQTFRSLRSHADIEEEGGQTDMVNRASPKPHSRTSRYTKLTKQSSLSHAFNKAGSESPTPNYQRSSKSYSDLNDSVNFFKNQEQNLMLSHHRRPNRPKLKRNKFVKQYSESHAETYNVGSPSEYMKLSKPGSIDCVDESRLSVRPICSRQTTFSDEDDIIPFEKPVYPSINPSMDALQLLENTDSDSQMKVTVKNRRKTRNAFGDVISRSVGNLMEKSSRIKHNIRKKSASLFTINKETKEEPEDEIAYTIDQDAQIVEVKKQDHPIYLDDALLDGNMADILCAVDALFPGKDCKAMMKSGDVLGLR